MASWSEVLEGTELALNSAGSATERMEIHAESLSGKLNSLQSSWDSFVMALGTSDVAKVVVDALTSLVDILNVLLNQIPIVSDLIKGALVAGALNVLLGSVTKIVNLVKSGGIIGGLFSLGDIGNLIKALTKGVSVIDLFTEAMKRAKDANTGLSGMFQLFSVSLKEAATSTAATTVATTGLAAAEGTATVSTTALTGALVALQAALPIIGAVSLGIAAIAAAWVASDGANPNRSIDEAKEKLQEYQDELSNTESELETISSKLDATQSAIDAINSGGPLSITDKTQLEMLQDQLDLLKEQQAVLNEQKTQEANQTMRGAAELYTEQQGSYFLTADTKTYGNTGNYLNSYNKEMQGVDLGDEKRITALKELYTDLINEQQTYLNQSQEIPDTLGNAISQVTAWLEEYQAEQEAFVTSYQQAVMSGASAEMTEQYRMLYTVAQQQRLEITKLLDPTTYTQLKISDLIDTDVDFEDLKETFDSLVSNYNAGSIDASELKNGIEEAIQEAAQDADIVDALEDEFGDLDTSEIEQTLRDAFERDYDIDLDSVNSELEETVNYAQQAADEFDALNSSIDGIQSAYSSLSSAVEEYNQYGTVSLDTLQSLLSLDASYIAALEEQNGQLGINVNAFATKATAQLESAKAAAVDKAIGELDALAMQAQAEAASGSSNKMSNMTANAKALVPQLGSAANAAVAAAKSFALMNSVAAAEDAGVDQASIDNVMKGLNTQLEMINDVANSMKTSISGATNAITGFGGAATSAGNSAADAAEDATDALKEQYEAQKEVLEAQKESLERQKEALEDELDGLNNARDAIEDLIDVTMDMLKQQYEDEQDALDAQLDAFEEKINKQKDYLELLRDEEEHQDELAEKNRSIADIQAQLEELRYDTSASGQAQRLELLDQLNEAQKELSDYQADYDYDTKQDALDKELDSFKAQIDAQKEYIENVLMDEYNLYQQAIELIQGRSQEFYNDLIEYNRVYGSHIDQDIIQKWSLAYAALDEYGYLGVGVQGILEGIAARCIQVENENNAIEESIKAIENEMQALEDGYNAAVKAAQDLASASNSARDAANGAISAYNNLRAVQNANPATGHGGSSSHGGQSISMYHTGTDYVKPASSWLNDMLGLNEDETAAILKKGEAVIPDYANPFNDDGKYNPNFAVASPSTIAPASNNDVEYNYKVEIGDIVIEGDADENTVKQLRKVKDEITDNVFKTINKLQNIGGYKNTKIAH